VTITDGEAAKITVGHTLNSPKGSMVGIDKDRNDYSWHNHLTEKEVFFVTRLKSNAKYQVIHRHPVLKKKGFICDQTIEFTGIKTSNKCPIQLCCIG
jgi:hypothetical protein